MATQARGGARSDTGETPVVLVTGATGGLGRAAAASFAADGARLGLVGTDAGRLTTLAGELGLAQDAWVPVVADLRDEAGARAAVDAVTSRFGRVDVLLHLVGGWTGGTPLVETDPATLTAMLDQHVWTTYHLVRAAIPGMVERHWGRVIAVVPTSTVAPGPNAGPYTAAKAAQEALLRVLAREVAADGVTANLLAVTAIDEAHARETEPSSKNASWTTPEELVAAIRFLCSDAAAAVNGNRIALDGRR